MVLSENRYVVRLDLQTQEVTSVVANPIFKQGNDKTGVLEIHLATAGVAEDITGWNILLKFLRSDGSVTSEVMATGSTDITTMDIPNGVFQCILESYVLTVPGIVSCEAKLTKDAQILIAPSFDFTVDSSINAISFGYITAIEAAIAGWLIQFTANETSRTKVFLANESARATAEGLRVIAELLRVKEFSNLKGDVVSGSVLHTNLQADMTTGSPLDIALKSDIATGTISHETLQADIAAAKLIPQNVIDGGDYGDIDTDIILDGGDY